MRLVLIASVYLNPDHVVSVDGGPFIGTTLIRVVSPGAGGSYEYQVDGYPHAIVRSLRKPAVASGRATKVARKTATPSRRRRT